MDRIAFYANAGKEGAEAVREKLAAFAASLGLAESDEPEAVVVLGGDGTMLSAVRRFPGVPLLGLNLGSLGYLTDVERPRFEDAIRLLAEGRYEISSRTALAVAPSSGPEIALNDIVVERGASGHAASIDLFVDGVQATRFVADGLVVATPTGSTAHSLSAGGPILMPDTESIVITPVCPHALGFRPLVLRDGARLRIRARLRAGDGPLAAFADGVACAELRDGEEIEVFKAARSVPLVRLNDYNPYRVLERKLGWGGGVAGGR